MSSFADLARERARAEYVIPARRRGESTVRIPVRDVHKALGLENRYPIVCNALRSDKFLKENHLTIDGQVGPASGFGASVEITYRLTEQDVMATFLRMRGVLKETFEALGGGEAFIRGEREDFYGGADPLLAPGEHK